MPQCVEPKQFHDVVGYHNRFDVFDLKLTRKRLAPIEFLDEAPHSIADGDGWSKRSRYHHRGRFRGRGRARDTNGLRAH